MKRKSKFRDHQEENRKSNIKGILFYVFNLRFSVLSLINKRSIYNKILFTNRKEKHIGEILVKSMNYICKVFKLYPEYEYSVKDHRENNDNEFTVNVTLPSKTIKRVVMILNRTKFSVRSSNSMENNFVVRNLGGLNNNALG